VEGSSTNYFRVNPNLAKEPVAAETGEVMAKWVCLVYQEAFLSLMKHRQRHCGAPRPCSCQNKYRP